MEKLKFSTRIHAPKEKVWEILWNEDNYSRWTSAFCEGSYAVTDDWKVNTKVHFLSGDGEGMVSMVAANTPNRYMSFRHAGIVKDGVEDTTSEIVKEWAGGFENYLLEEEEGSTRLDVEMDVTKDHVDYFTNTWPKALENVKQLSEGNSASPVLQEVGSSNKENAEAAEGPEVERGITPFLCFNGNAEEAVRFYTSIFKDSRIGSLVRIPASPESGNREMVTATFFLNGQEFYALDGGPAGSFSPSMSLFIKCHTQDEVDHLWERLSEGGQKQRCGWLTDKFGICWQVVPVQLGKLLYNGDPQRSKKVLAAMLQMDKIVIRELEEAYAVA